MAICTQQSEVPLVRVPILTAPCPIVLAALRFDFLGWVDVVDIKRARIRETAARAFSAKTRNEFKLLAPIVRVLGLRVSVPPRSLTFGLAELRVAGFPALPACPATGPSGGNVTSLTAVLSSAVFNAVGVHLRDASAMAASDLNSGFSHIKSIRQISAKSYFEIACKRIRDAYNQPDMFIEQEKQPKPEQLALLDGDA